VTRPTVKPYEMSKWRPVEVLESTKKIFAVPETSYQRAAFGYLMVLAQKELGRVMEGFGVEAVERQEGGK
jgi:hypothetical protein